MQSPPPSTASKWRVELSEVGEAWQANSKHARDRETPVASAQHSADTCRCTSRCVRRPVAGRPFSRAAFERLNPDKELTVIDPSVVDDATRSLDLCVAGQEPLPPWSFGAIDASNYMPLATPMIWP